MSTSAPLTIKRAVQAVANDSEDQPFVSSSVFVTTTGTLTVTLLDMPLSETVSYDVVIGERHPLRVKRFLTSSDAAIILED